MTQPVLSSNFLHYIRNLEDRIAVLERLVSTSFCFVGNKVEFPLPVKANEGQLALATDENGGTLYVSKNSQWSKAAASVGV